MLASRPSFGFEACQRRAAGTSPTFSLLHKRRQIRFHLNLKHRLPSAPDYIRKVEKRGAIGKKRKTAKC
jgi:hypothetical protein